MPTPGRTDFARFWAAQAISSVGSQVTALALPLTAIATLHAGALQVSLVAAATFAPVLVLALPFGTLVDRRPRRTLLVAADVGRAAALVSIPAASAAGVLSIAQLYAVAVVSGALTTLFDVAYQSFVPAVAGRERLARANSQLEATRSFALVAGPSLGGVLVAAVTAPGAILADAISFAVSAALLLGIGAETRAPAVAPGRRELLGGLRLVARSPLLRPVVLAGALYNFFDRMLMAIFFVYVVRQLSLGAGTIGLVLAVGNVGPLLGALAAPRWTAWLGFGRGILLAALLWAGTLAIPLAPPHAAAIPFLVLAFLVSGFGTLVVNVGSLTLRQAITPDELLGRVTSAMRLVIAGTLPFGAVFAGVVASAAGNRAAVWVSAAGLSLAFLPLLPLRRVREI